MTDFDRTLRHMSVRATDRGYANMIDSEFEGCGVEPGLVFLKVKRGGLTKIETLAKGKDEDDIFEGKFFDKDCYFFLLTEEKPQGGDFKAMTNQSLQAGSPFNWKIFIWKGKKASLIQFGFAGTKASDLQKKLIENGSFHDCSIQKEMQGKESEEFRALFPDAISVSPGNRGQAVIATEGAPISKSPKLFEIAQDKLKRIPIREEYLRDDRNYILDVGSAVYSHSGKKCGRVEKAYTEEMARRRCKTDYRKKVKAISVAHNGKRNLKKFHGALKANEQNAWAKWKDEFDPQLYEMDISSGKLVLLEKEDNVKILFDAEVLQPNKIFVLDCITEIYLWVGKGISMGEVVEVTAIVEAIMESEERPRFVTLEILRQNMETVYFKERFFGFDEGDLVEIGGNVRQIKSEKEFLIYSKGGEPKLRRVSGELRRVVQFLQERETDFDTAHDLHLTKDESGSLIGFKYDQKGELKQMEEWEFGFFESTKMYTYIYTFKNETMHYIFTWEGEHASTRAKTVAGISTTGKEIPGLTEEMMGTKVFKFITQGREPRLLSLLLEQRGVPIMIKQGVPTERQRNQGKIHPTFLDNKRRKVFVFEVNEIGKFGARTTEVPFQTVVDNGLCRKTCYVFFRGAEKKQMLNPMNFNVEVAEVFYWLGGHATTKSKTLAQKVAKDPVLPRSLQFQDFATNDTNSVDLSLERSKTLWSKSELNLSVNEEDILPHPLRPIRLFRFSLTLRNVGGMFIHDLGDGAFTQQDLNQKEVFLLDSGSSKLFLWIGAVCTNDQIKLGLECAARYKIKSLPRISDTINDGEIELVLIDSGSEPMSFKSCFYGWKNFKVSAKKLSEKFEDKLNEYYRLAKMNDKQRKFQEDSAKKVVRSQRLEKFKSDNTLRKSRMKTLKRGKIVAFKKTMNEFCLADKVGDRITIDPNTKQITVSNIGRPLRINQDQLTVDEICSSIHLGEYTWALFGYKDEMELDFLFRGQGNVDHLKNALSNYDTGREVFYAILQIPAKRLKTKLTKENRNLFIIFIPEATPPMMRAASNSHQKFVEELLGPFFNQVTLRSVDEIDEDRTVDLASHRD